MEFFALYNNSVAECFSCMGISAKTNRLFFTIGGPDGGGALLQLIDAHQHRADNEYIIPRKLKPLL
jgi:hypothetical protein